MAITLQEVVADGYSISREFSSDEPEVKGTLTHAFEGQPVVSIFLADGANGIDAVTFKTRDEAIDAIAKDDEARACIKGLLIFTEQPTGSEAAVRPGLPIAQVTRPRSQREDVRAGARTLLRAAGTSRAQGGSSEPISLY